MEVLRRAGREMRPWTKVCTMDRLAEWFPYPSYRPGQREMLERVSMTARRGGILMIDAPTGYGKSSAVSALLAEAEGRKVIVAVRTVSQLSTFLRELSLIRRKKPDLRFSYLLGKANCCLIPGAGDVYRRCEALKALSLSLMKARAEAGSTVPLRDPVIREQMRRFSEDQPVICPWFIGSRIFMEGEEGVRAVASSLLRTLAERMATETIPPDQLPGLCRDVCPYEVLVLAAKSADALVVNFNHLLDDEIRTQIYASLGIEPEDVLLLIDEAHNCGDAVQAVQSVALEGPWLEQVLQELSRMRRSRKGAEGLHSVASNTGDFMRALLRSTEAEDWFDPAIFERTVLRETLYSSLQEVAEELRTAAEVLRRESVDAGDYRITGLERFAAFVEGVCRASEDPSFLTVYRKEGEEISLEVQNIDPGARLSEIAGGHGCCVMISGTFSPVEGFRRYYFGDGIAETLALPNVFPPGHRLVLCASDVTTAFSMRQNRENVARIREYLSAFSSIPGNLAVYFPSYQMLEQFSAEATPEGSAHRVFVEPREPSQAAGLLKEFLALPSRGEEGIIMAVCGGKWSEGLDYRGELLSGAMVVGLPLSPFNRVRKMVNGYFRSKFGEEGEFLSYTVPAINRALQAIGRVIRTPEDRGILVLADRRFLEKRIRMALPSWVAEEMIVCTSRTIREEMERWRCERA